MRVDISTGRERTLYHVPSIRLLEICLYWHTWSPILLPKTQSLLFHYVPKRIFCL